MKSLKTSFIALAISVALCASAMAQQTITVGGSNVSNANPFPTSNVQSGAAVSATNPLSVAESQIIYTPSAGNTSTVQLTSGATFTGTIDGIVNEQVVSINMASDQPIILTIKQCIDAACVSQNPPLIWYVPASRGFNQAPTIGGNYVQITAQNIGLSTTTTFNLNVYYGPSQVPIGAGGAVPVNSFSANPISTIVRTANTTAYTANTGWSHTASSCTTAVCYLHFDGACNYPGEQVAIPEIDIFSSANQTTALQGILWLFNTIPGTIIQDDAAFNIAAADFANLTAGSFNGVPFTLASSQSSGAANAGISLNGSTLGSPLVATCAAGAVSIYGMVQVVNAYTPVSAEVLTVQIKTLALN